MLSTSFCRTVLLRGHGKQINMFWWSNGRNNDKKNMMYSVKPWMLCACTEKPQKTNQKAGSQSTLLFLKNYIELKNQVNSLGSFAILRTNSR